MRRIVSPDTWYVLAFVAGVSPWVALAVMIFWPELFR